MAPTGVPRSYETRVRALQGYLARKKPPLSRPLPDLPRLDSDGVERLVGVAVRVRVHNHHVPQRDQPAVFMSLICTDARWNPATCGANQGSWERRFDLPRLDGDGVERLVGVAVRVRVHDHHVPHVPVQVGQILLAAISHLPS